MKKKPELPTAYSDRHVPMDMYIAKKHGTYFIETIGELTQKLGKLIYIYGGPDKLKLGIHYIHIFSIQEKCITYAWFEDGQKWGLTALESEKHLLNDKINKMMKK